MRKGIISLLIFFVLGTAIYGGTLWSAVKGAPFLAAKAYLMNSHTIPNLGEVSDVHLVLFSSYHERTAGSEGQAHFSVEIMGSAEGKKVANVEMQMQHNVWTVQRITIDGQTFLIE